MSGCAGRHLAGDRLALGELGDLQVVGALQVQPKLRRRAEVASKPQRERSRQRYGTLEDRRHPLGRQTNPRRKIARSELRITKPVCQNLTRMNGWHPGRSGQVDVREVDRARVELLTGDGHLAKPSVIVSEPYVESIAAVPRKAYAPLHRDADRPLSSPVVDQLLEPVPGTQRKIVQIGCYVQLPQPRPSTTLKLGMDILYPGTAEYAGGASIGEALDHLHVPLASAGDVAGQRYSIKGCNCGRP